MKEVISISLLFLFLRCYNQDFPAFRYTVEEGLVQRQVMALDISPDGVLWIGTKGGVSRFNGFYFSNLTSKDGLLSDEVKSILVDPLGQVWIFHYEGITKILGSKISMIRYPHYLSNAVGGYDNHGRIWFIGDRNGQNLFFRVSNDSVVPVPFDTVAFGQIITVIKDKSNGFYKLLTSKGILYPGVDTLYPFPESDPVPEELQFATSMRNGSGFKKYTKANNVLIYSTPAGQEKPLADSLSYINRLLTDGLDQLWVGTEKGLLKIPTIHIVNFLNTQFLQDVWTILPDCNGRIWFGNYGKGLSYWNGSRFGKPGKNQLSDPGIYNHQKYHIYPGGISNYNNRTYFNTSKGVLEFDGNRFSPVKGLPEKAVYFSIHDTVNDRLLFSIHQRGLYSWNGKGGARLIAGPFDAEMERIESMAFDQRNRLWLGSVQGILIMEKDTVIPGGLTGIPVESGARCLYCDSAGAMWFGNPDGLFVYIGDSVKKIGHPLLNQSIKALAGGPGNRIIAGTAKGIAILSFDPDRVKEHPDVEWLCNRNYYQGGECQNNGITMDSLQRIWIACANGAVRIDPGFFDRPRSNLKMGVREIKFHEPGRKNPEEQLFIPDGSLPMNRMNSVRILWDASDMTSTHDNPIKIRLHPIEDKWIEPKDFRPEDYYNLKPGLYTFQIQTNALSGELMGNETSFRIKPRLYQSVAFVSAVGVFVAGILIWISWWLARLTLKRKQLRIMREREINDLRFRALTNQLSPHFTFNVLNAIGSLILTKEPMAAYENVNKFSKMLRSLLGNPEGFMVPLRQEFEFVTNYLDLEALRFPEKLNFLFDIDPNVEMDFRVPRMILQIPAENAIKHGLSVKPEGGTLAIHVKYNDAGDLVLSIKDDGVGRKPPGEQRKDTNGRGLKIIREILDFQNKTQGTSNSLRITDLTADGRPAGTLVEIVLTTNDR